MIIGIIGKARSGKTTVGGILSDELGYTTYALADPIKKTLNNLYGWDDRHADGELKECVDARFGFSPRQAYQRFGTEYGRALNPTHWLDLAAAEYNKRGNIIITDIRFDNEAQFIKDLGGVLIKVVTPDDIDIVNPHESEQGVSDSIDIDYVINNDHRDGLPALTVKVKDLTKIIGSK